MGKAFMQFQLFKGKYVKEETDEGTIYTPGYLYEGDLEKAEEEDRVREGFLWRASAPGYLDCTEWMPAESKFDAECAYFEAICACPSCGENLTEENYYCPECLWSSEERPIWNKFTKEVEGQYEGDPGRGLVLRWKEKFPFKEFPGIRETKEGILAGHLLIKRED